jgi:hypothetical protein
MAKRDARYSSASLLHGPDRLAGWLELGRVEGGHLS